MSRKDIIRGRMLVRFSALKCANVRRRYSVVDGFLAPVHEEYRVTGRGPSTRRSDFLIARQGSMTECRTAQAEVSIVWSLDAIPSRWLRASRAVGTS